MWSCPPRLSVVALLIAGAALGGCGAGRPLDEVGRFANSALASISTPLEARHETVSATPVAWDMQNDPAVTADTPHTVADVDPPYMLDSGDKIRVLVYGQPSLSRIYTIDGAGFFSLPLLGPVKARGLTTFDLEKAVANQLGSSYVRDPQVSIEVAATRPFFILGEVRNAGQYAYINGLTVHSAVAVAGGYTERASERSATVTRRINGIVEKRILPPEAVILPGDTIYVSERFF